MSRRQIGQEAFSFSADESARRSSLDDLTELIDWAAIEKHLCNVSASAKGEPAWPPLCLFKALLLAVWYDLSDVKLAEALDDRASFRRFCGFSANEATPSEPLCSLSTTPDRQRSGQTLFDAVTRQLRAKAITVKTGTLVDATVIASANDKDGEAAWSKHRRRRAVFGFKAHVGADAETALVEEVAVSRQRQRWPGRLSGAPGRSRRCLCP